MTMMAWQLVVCASDGAGPSFFFQGHSAEKQATGEEEEEESKTRDG